MSLVQFFFALATVLLLSVGQVLFKIASARFEFSLSGVGGLLLNGRFMVALCIYVLATLMWLMVLKSIPLRMAYPFAALAFVIVPVLAHFSLGESVGVHTFVGACFIALGVFVSVMK